MGGVNACFDALAPMYLFREMAEQRAAYEAAHPGEKILSLGIGDVTRSLAPCVSAAMVTAARGMATEAGFHGYPPAFGYDFLREAIAQAYVQRGVAMEADAVYVSDGAKTDAALLPHLFDEVTVCLADPTYPVYRDAHLLAGHHIRTLGATAENGYLPPPPDTLPEPEIVYLTSPGNPIGVAYDHAGLAAWVQYARKSGSLIIFDAAYAAFLPNNMPHSIYEIEGSRVCAAELGSFSKSAGFTGVRCAWSIFPDELEFGGRPLAPLWRRLKSISSNGVSYPVQCGAAAALTPEGKRATESHVHYYLENAALLAAALRANGTRFVGGICSPYLWVACPRGLTSWETFSFYLRERQLLVTPGVGFGAGGEGYVRLSALGTRDTVCRAAERLYS